MIEIRNDYDCFVELWRKLEHTRQLLGMQYRRFCIRRVLQSWMGDEATDDLIWEVCLHTVVDGRHYYGYDQLPPPSLHPKVSRAFLLALVAVKLGIGVRDVDLTALNKAYRTAFPNGRQLNINKKSSKPP